MSLLTGTWRPRHSSGMETAPAVTAIAQAIQLSVAPVFLLAGVGAILNLLASRLARVIDRARVLEELYPQSTGVEHQRHVWELRILDRRMMLVNASIFLIVSSAIAISLVVAVLFVGELAHLKIGNIIAIAFILAMLLFVAGLILFLIETRVAIHAFRVREELLERGERNSA